MEKTTTNRDFYSALITLATTGSLAYTTDEGDVEISAEELKAWAEKNIDQIDRRNEKARERTAARKAEGDELTELVYEALTDEFETIADIAARVDAEDISVSKVQYRVGQLAKTGRAEKGNITIPGGEGIKARTLVAYRKLI